MQNYLEQNIGHSDKWALGAFRNCTEHLNAIRNANQYIGEISEVTSYFALYHYLVQRSIMNQFEYESTHKSKRKGHEGEYIISEEQVNPKLLDYFRLVEEHHTYCKDFVKALNVPFAYNLPRYKNLSIKELFDRNDYKPNKGKEWEQ